MSQQDFIGGGGKIKGGYFGMPGRGPAGESCGTCNHCAYTMTRNPRRYYKCLLLKPTAGEGTDIRLKSPACQHWLEDEPEPEAWCC